MPDEPHAFQCIEDEFIALCDRYAGKSVAYSIHNPTDGEEAHGLGTLEIRPDSAAPGWFTLVITATNEDLENLMGMHSTPEYTLGPAAFDKLMPGSGGIDWILAEGPGAR